MRLSILLLCLILAACGDQAGTSGSQVTDAVEQSQISPVKAIPWFEGSVEEAFAQASRVGKPVFLYWGAQWCPPCHELKATIFQRPEFIQQSALFVPVYLDGDSERAQLYGERFGVMGYPTVIIFSSDGEEVTRIPGGMNIDQYVGVMDLALNALRPVADLVEEVRLGETLDDSAWKLLASYSWGQDRGRALGEQELSEAATMLAAACPDRLSVEKSKLQMLAIEAWLADEDRDQSLAAQYLANVNVVMDEQWAIEANMSSLLFNSGDMVLLLAQEGEARQRLHGRLQETLLALIADPETQVLTRLDALYAWLEVNLALMGEEDRLTEGQQQWLYQETEKARQSLNAYQQHTAINTVWQLYLNAGLEQEARDALAMGMEISKQPYYFMSGMGSLEYEAGNEATALDWYRKAWDAASGDATRAQWGTNYLMALIKLSPEDDKAIGETGVAILDELGAQNTGLHHRSAMRLERVSQRLLEWATADDALESRQQVLGALRVQMDEICSELAEQPETCDTFLRASQAV